MAPDINSMPSSPRRDRQETSQTSANPTTAPDSQQMPPPPPPPLNRQQSYPHHSPVMSSNEYAGEPQRHPRQMTVAEMFSESEKETEAVVNRLTRELTALRAQTASVASNASQSSTSTSASLLPVDISDPNPTHQMTGATHPTPSRRHRSSSSLSTRSIPNTPSTTVSAAASGITNVSTQVQAGSITSAPTGSISQASADRAAAAGGTGSLSRPPSMSLSGTSTPARQSMESVRHSLPPGASYTLPHRPSLSRDASYTSQATISSNSAQQGTPAPPLSPAQNVTTQHYIDTAAYRSELDSVKAENEALRQRVIQLERALRNRRRDSSNSDAARPSRERDVTAPVTSPNLSSPEGRATMSPAGVAAWAAGDGGVGGVAPPRERSESQSTTASSRRGLVGEDDVRLGESAGSAGIGRSV